MRCAVLLLVFILAVPGAPLRYELHGRLKPAARASVWLHGAVSPFEDGTLADDSGRFRFRDLPPGAYTLGAFVPGRGEMRQTIDIGPSTAGAKGRIDLVIDLDEAQFESRDSMRRGALVSASELAIPERAHREYNEAEKRLNKRDVEGAVEHLERAVEIAPRFAVAWNHLGTIAYQSRDFARAENCFRKALEADPKAYEPLVNLGGVLVNLQKFNEALQYNRHAVLTRPNDALANSQLGMTYFYLGKLDFSRKYLTAATQLDPRHFSHPQLLLAEIDLRQGQRTDAANQLNEFLKYHPDWPEAQRIKDNIARLRSAAALSPQTATADTGSPETYAATGMARSFSDSFTLPPLDDYYDAPSGRYYSIVHKESGYFFGGRDAAGTALENRVNAIIGSGRHFRVLLSRTDAGAWMQLPLAWYTEGAGHWGVNPAMTGESHAGLGQPLSADCLRCHTSQTANHFGGIGCEGCHASAPKPTQAVCLNCHLQSVSPNTGHGAFPGREESISLNSAGYRLLQSRCYQASAGKLTCATCHAPHAFSKTLADYRAACRSCHPTMHNSAALNCTRCHMPKRSAEDVSGVMVTDHKIQRPL
jgi:tetratricopeptide (TPR) repeat protein